MTASDQDARKGPGHEREGRDPSALDVAAGTDSVDFDLDIDVDFDAAEPEEILPLDDDSDDEDIFDLSQDGALEAQEVVEGEGFRRLDESELIDKMIEGEEFDLFEFVEEASDEAQPPPPPSESRQPAGVDPRVLGRVNIGPRSSVPPESSAFKDLQRRKQELEGECMALEAQLEQAISKLKSNENRLTETQRALEVSSHALSVSEVQRRSLVEQIAVSMVEGEGGNRDDLEVWIAELEAEAETREKEHRARVQDLEGALEAASVDEGSLNAREGRILALEGEIEAIQVSAAKADAVKSARIAALEAEVARMAGADAAAASGELASEALIRENESLRFRIQTLEPALEMSRKKNETYRGDVARMKKSVADVQEELLAVKALKERAEAAERGLATIEAERDALKPEMDGLSARLIALEAERDAADAQKADLASRAIEAERQRDALTVQISTAQEAHAQVKAALDEAISLREKLQRKSMEAAQERERLVAEEIAGLKSALEAARKGDTDQRAHTESLQSALEALKAESEALKAEGEEIRGALKAENEAAQAEVERTQALHLALEAEREALAVKAAANQVDLRALQERLDAAEERRAALDRDLAEAASARTALENERESLLERTRDLQEELVAAKVDSRAAQDLLDEHDTEADKARAEALEEANARVADLKARVEQLEIEGDGLRVQLVAAQAGAQRAEAFEFALQGVRADLPSFDVDLDHSVASNDPPTVIQGLDVLGAEDLALLQGIRDGEREVVRLRAEVDTLRAACEGLDADREVLQMQRDALEEELGALKQDLGAQAERAADQDVERDRLQETLQSMGVENEELQRSIQAMVSEFEVHQADDKDAQAAHGRAEALSAELARQLERNQELSRRLDEVLEEVLLLRNQFEERPDAAEFHELQSRLLELESEVARTPQDGGSQVDALRAEYEDLAGAYEALQQSHFERGKQLMSALADAERMRANLVRIAQELSAVREEADNLARHNERVEARNDELARRVGTLEQEVAGISKPDRGSLPTIEALDREIKASNNSLSVDRAAILSASSLGIHEGDLDFDSKAASTANIRKPIDGAYPRGYVLTDDELSADEQGRAPGGSTTQLGLHADFIDKAPKPPTTQFGVSIHGDEGHRPADFDVDDDFDEFEPRANFLRGHLDDDLEDDLVRPPVNVLSADLSLDFERDEGLQERGSDDSDLDDPDFFEDDDFDDFEPASPNISPGAVEDEDPYGDDFFGAPAARSEGQARDFYGGNASYDTPGIEDEILEDLESLDDPLVDRNSAPTIDPISHLESNNLMDSCPNADFSRAKGVDHRGGFLLAMANGETTIKDIIELSSSVLDSGSAAQLVVEMIQSGALRL